MSEPLAPPAGFRIGHWTDEVGRTGCTVVIAPEGTRGGVDVRGGGPGTRETDVVSPMAGTDRVSAVMFAGGSAYGLAAADGAMRWLEEHGIGYPTPAALVPIVPAAIAYDLAEGDAAARPTAESGYAACEAAREGVPERGRVGAGTGTAAGKVLGRGAATPSGVGYAATRGGFGSTVAALAVANPFGDVLARGRLRACGRAGDGAPRTVDFIAALDRAPTAEELEARNTTLVCVMTDASARQGGVHAGGARGERGGGAGGRAGVHGRGRRRRVLPGERRGRGRGEVRGDPAGVAAARVTAEAIRDAVTSVGEAASGG